MIVFIESAISIGIIIHLFEQFFDRIQVLFHSLRVIEQVLKVIFVLQSVKLGLKLRFKQRFWKEQIVNTVSSMGAGWPRQTCWVVHWAAIVDIAAVSLSHWVNAVLHVFVEVVSLSWIEEIFVSIFTMFLLLVYNLKQVMSAHWVLALKLLYQSVDMNWFDLTDLRKPQWLWDNAVRVKYHGVRRPWHHQLLRQFEWDDFYSKHQWRYLVILRLWLT